MLFNHKTSRLFLDMDGVLADFDRAAIPLMDGYNPEEFERKFGSKVFWERVNSNPNFFLELELMQDAMQLYDAVKHLRPIILTGMSRDMQGHINHKLDWGLKHFGREQIVICCQASKKSQFCLPNDIIVDDRKIYKHLWEKKGGIWITHTSASNSLKKLEELGVI